MAFKKFSAGLRTYGGDPDNGFQYWKEKDVSNVAFSSLRLQKVFENKVEELELVRQLVLCLSLCHTIMVSETEEYIASSPDELALVQFGRFIGAKFVGRDEEDGSMEVVLSEQLSSNGI